MYRQTYALLRVSQRVESESHFFRTLLDGALNQLPGYSLDRTVG